MRLVVDWAHRDHLPVAVFQRGRRGRVIVMSGLGDNLRILHLLRPSDHVICFTVGDYRAQTYRMMHRVVLTFDLDVERVSVLCNYPAQARAAESSGLMAHFCNKNAFINERTFRITPMEKRFDAVSNARLVRHKRVRLARLVENLAIVRGHEFEATDYDDPKLIPHAYLSHGVLSPREVVRVLSASHVGLALSSREGACQASSEYLLCGLPVVSTPSCGGRDIWYDDRNSLICEPKAEAVRDAVRDLIYRLRSGQLDSRAIRERHLEQAREHRRCFIRVLERAFDDVGADGNPAELFERSFDAPGIAPRYRAYRQICDELAGE
jgi:hypothetical protein